MGIKLLRNIKLIVLIIIAQQEKTLSSLQVQEIDPITLDEYSFLVPFSRKEDSIKVDSAYDLHISDMGEKNTITLRCCVIFGRLYVPKNIQRIVLHNTILQGGIKFESDLAEVEKVGYVILGPLETGIRP